MTAYQLKAQALPKADSLATPIHQTQTPAAHYSAPQAPVTSTSTPLPRGVPPRGSAPRNTSTPLDGVTEEPSTTPSVNSVPTSTLVFCFSLIYLALQMSSPMKFLILLVNSEVITSLVFQNIDHARKNVRESKTSLCENEFNSLKNFVNENPSYLEFLKQNKSGLEDLFVKQFNTMNSLINSLNERENHKFERKNRKLCSLSSPHLTQNNPLLNKSRFTYSSPPPAPECHPDETRTSS
ncbi:hypothetical protein VP01_1854g3 [Puccinia sorghi]|uniref:Uncharacterized protein n=1 Tax=Puccinia sorghi TaxID=27349 RepID=A0A0L6VDL5_9BASI|nr:hypothetical protein VP01_1854g3 [Puccinia sorghi]